MWLNGRWDDEVWHDGCDAKASMIVQPVDIPTPDGSADGYVLYPAEEGHFPGVILYMDGIGIRPTLVEFAKRIAQRGYFVLLPNLFYRNGRAPLFDYEQFLAGENREEHMGKMISLIGSLTPDRIQLDSTAYLNFLDSQTQVEPGSIGTTGYCMGGGISLRTAAYHPDRVAAAASFHGGRLATEEPDSPHLLASQIQAELYLGHAKDDRSCPPEQIERLEKALQAAGLEFQSEVYDAGHGWTMPDVGAYNEAAAEKALQQLFELLDRKLIGGYPTA
jgi:carboxymethylenebutenolidase